MKYLSCILISILFVLTSCIGSDIIDDYVEPVLRINNPINGLKVGETYNFMATYFNNVGEETPANIIWSSSNDAIVSVSNMGLASALAEGQVTLTAKVTNNGVFVEDSSSIIVVASDEEISNPPASSSKQGTIKSTSSYTLSGEFTIEVIEGTNDLKLSLHDNYIADTRLPGLYLYLTNNPNSISSAKELGKVEVFSGAHEYVITNIGINDFKYLLYWCKPFSVKVGDGEIN